MVFHGEISPKAWAYCRLLIKQMLSVREIARITGVSKSSIQRFKHQGIPKCVPRRSTRKYMGGRPAKLTLRYQRHIQRALSDLRKTEGHFTSVKGVIICEEYDKMNGVYFSDFIRRNFIQMYGDADKDHVDYFVQDGDPSQNLELAIDALKRVKAKVFKSPPRSPDLNPIENVFHLAKNSLKNSAKTIDRETRSEFVVRIRLALYSIPTEMIYLWTNESI